MLLENFKLQLSNQTVIGFCASSNGRYSLLFFTVTQTQCDLTWRVNIACRVPRCLLSALCPVWCQLYKLHCLHKVSPGVDLPKS